MLVIHFWNFPEVCIWGLIFSLRGTKNAFEDIGITSDEIIYLKQQLVIGGSTLDSVLSAEARLYEAESKEINFLAEKRKAQLAIVSNLGLLSPALGLNDMWRWL